MAEQTTTPSSNVEEKMVQLQFLKPESDEVDFTVDIPEDEFNMIATAASEEGKTFEEKILEIVTQGLEGLGSHSSSSEED